MTGRRTPSAIAQTARRSPSDALGNPASITSTPSVSSWRARRSFSSAVMELPGACSPSRSVVSKMMTSLPMDGSRAAARVHGEKKAADLVGCAAPVSSPSRLASCSSARFARAADRLLSGNAQQDQDQQQDQRELHHEAIDTPHRYAAARARQDPDVMR